ncbi:MAG: 30S ribosomal protein S27ae [Candidatus Woesearchaeota archaeon]
MRNKSVEVWKYYQISEGKIQRLRKKCPKCGDAFLADHKTRLVCGKCGYMEKK